MKKEIYESFWECFEFKHGKLEQFPRHEFKVNNLHFEYIDGLYFEKVSSLKCGLSFGELALIDERNSLRKATIKCETDVFFATLSREFY